jgi:uncharacterized membrane-anchored protein
MKATIPNNTNSIKMMNNINKLLNTTISFWTMKIYVTTLSETTLVGLC